MDSLASKIAKRYAKEDPPRWLRDGISSGSLDPDAMDIWDYVVTALGDRFEPVVAASYWKHQADRLGYDTVSVPTGGSSPYKAKATESVEDWLRQAKMTARLLKDQDKLVGKRRREFSGDKEAQAAFSELQRVTSRYAVSKSPTVAFEKAFQKALLVADKALDRMSENWRSELEAGVDQIRQVVRFA